MAIFWLVKMINRLYRKEEPPPKGPTPTEALLAEIRDELKARPRV
jgi:large conductance mechanosensitive channel